MTNSNHLSNSLGNRIEKTSLILNEKHEALASSNTSISFPITKQIFPTKMEKVGTSVYFKMLLFINLKSEIFFNTISLLSYLLAVLISHNSYFKFNISFEYNNYVLFLIKYLYYTLFLLLCDLFLAIKKMLSFLQLN